MDFAGCTDVRQSQNQSTQLPNFGQMYIELSYTHQSWVSLDPKNAPFITVPSTVSRVVRSPSLLSLEICYHL